MLALNSDRARQGTSALVWLVSALAILVLTTLSCSESCMNCPEACRLPSGRAVVDASVRLDEHGRFYSEGFSFSEGGAVRVPGEEGVEPDFIVLFMMVSEPEPEGMLLAEANLLPAFHRVGRAETMEEGRLLFEATSCVPEDAHLESVVGPVQPYQVWVVRTGDGKFGKILIVDTFFCSQSHDSAGITVGRLYGEITFDWQYQPDGSRCFE